MHNILDQKHENLPIITQDRVQLAAGIYILFPSITSGAKYSGVPRMALLGSLMCLANPKSMSFRCPESEGFTLMAGTIKMGSNIYVGVYK